MLNNLTDKGLIILSYLLCINITDIYNVPIDIISNAKKIMKNINPDNDHGTSNIIRIILINSIGTSNNISIIVIIKNNSNKQLKTSRNSNYNNSNKQ